MFSLVSVLWTVSTSTKLLFSALYVVQLLCFYPVVIDNLCQCNHEFSSTQSDA